MLFYLWAIPGIALIFGLNAYFSHNNSVSGGKWFFLVWAASCSPLWALMTKYSKNLIFDGLIYDIFGLIVYTTVIVALASKQTFSVNFYIGVAVAILGLIIMKI